MPVGGARTLTRAAARWHRLAKRAESRRIALPPGAPPRRRGSAIRLPGDRTIRPASPHPPGLSRCCPTTGAAVSDQWQRLSDEPSADDSG